VQRIVRWHATSVWLRRGRQIRATGRDPVWTDIPRRLRSLRNQQVADHGLGWRQRQPGEDPGLIFRPRCTVDTDPSSSALLSRSTGRVFIAIWAIEASIPVTALRHSKLVGTVLRSSYRSRSIRAITGPLAFPGTSRAQKILRGHAQRSACICADAMRARCSIRANYQSTTVHLPPAARRVGNH